MHQSKALFLPRQAMKPFLCCKCEDLLSKNGERYVLARCLRHGENFILRDVIEQKKAGIQALDKESYSLRSLLGSEADKYLYFAASIFWRATAIAWPLGKNNHIQIRLSEALQDGFRSYLHGEATFPKGAMITMIVFCEEDTPPLALFPISDPAHNNDLHRFCIPGIEFCLLTGQALPPDLQGNSHCYCDDLILSLESYKKSGFYKLASISAKDSIPKGKLGKIVKNKNLG